METKTIELELSSEKVFEQKLQYIHYNPVNADLCFYPEEYHYSSALFYEKGTDHFSIIWENKLLLYYYW